MRCENDYGVNRGNRRKERKNREDVGKVIKENIEL